ncbi:MAG: TolC family protein [Armatimonadetes bacterium]|nr:TolC family protein [Armatimonadota bacterium]
MNRRFAHPFLLAALVAGAMPAPAQVVPPAPSSLPSPLTLQQALAIALSHQPQQFIARASTTQALGAKQQTTAQYFPTLTPSYEYQSRSNALFGVPVQTFTAPSTTSTTTGTGTTGTGTTTGTTTTGTGGTGVVSVGQAQPRQTTGTGSTGTTTTTTTTTFSPNEVTLVRGGGLTVDLAQTLFDSGQRELANAQARRAVEAAQYGETNTRQDVIQTVTQDYYTLLEAIDLVKVAQAQVTRFQQTLELTQAQVEAGTAARISTFQSQADLATAQVTLLQNQNSVTTAAAALKNAMGVETSDPVQPAPLAQGDQLPPLPATGPQKTLDQYVQIAYANRPDLRQQQAVVQNNNSAVKIAQINAGLSFTTTFDLSYQATNDLGHRGLDTALLFNTSYPLFDAGRARGVVRSTRAQRDAATDQLALIRQSIRQNVEQAYATRAEALQAAQLAQAAVQAGQVNYDAAVASRRAGVATILDVTTAQATLTQAQDQYVTAIYNFYTADAALRRAAGQNDVTAGGP